MGNLPRYTVDFDEDIDHFRGYGWSDTKIEERLGWMPGTIAMRQRRLAAKSTRAKASTEVP